MLDLLPAELLLHIANYLSADLSDLASLLRTNRCLHLIVSPILHNAAIHTPDQYGRCIIRLAASQGNTALLQRLLEYGHGDGVDEVEPITGTTALHSAIMLLRRDAVTLLLRHGAGVTVRDRTGWTALHWAVLSGSCDMVREVLGYGANPRWGTADDGSGLTPLHMAITRVDREMVALLLRRGASGEARDEYQVRAADYALALAGEGIDGSGELVQLMGEMVGRWVGFPCLSRVMSQKGRVTARWRNVLSHEEFFANQ